MQGFHRTYETGAACQQRTLTPPDTWSCPTFGLACVLMSRPISPELVLFPDFWVSNIPRYFSFAFDYLRNIALIWILQLNSKQMSKVYHDGDWDLRLCSIVFFSNRGQKGDVNSTRMSTLLPYDTYISILVSIKRQFLVVFIDMEHDWQKTTLISVAFKNMDAANLTCHFHVVIKGIPHVSCFTIKILGKKV